PLRNGSVGDAAGTGPPRSGFRFPDRGAGPDDSGWASDGCHARSLCRLRTGGLAGTDSGWLGPRSHEWQATGSADDRRAPSCRNTKAVPRRHQQIGDRSTTSDRAHVRPPNPGSKVMKRPKRDPVREDRIHNEAIVDARPEEQAMSWYYYLESKISFPF